MYKHHDSAILDWNQSLGCSVLSVQGMGWASVRCTYFWQRTVISCHNLTGRPSSDRSFTIQAVQAYTVLKLRFQPLLREKGGSVIMKWIQDISYVACVWICVESYWSDCVIQYTGIYIANQAMMCNEDKEQSIIDKIVLCVLCTIAAHQLVTIALKSLHIKGYYRFCI